MKIKEKILLANNKRAFTTNMEKTKAGKAVLGITDAAAVKVKELLSKGSHPYLGIRIGVKTGGCRGKTYTFEYASEKQNNDIEVNDKGIRIFIDSRVVTYLLGTIIDYVDNKPEAGFMFMNPNVKSSCGCGRSFNTTECTLSMFDLKE
ncbi:hypothetical protein MIDIC_230078 [Alphaproteobacteria bacterium]